MRDVLRFYREAPDVLARPDLQQLTLDEYLLAQRYSQSFIDGHLLPLAAAIWSSSASEIRSYPLLAFVRFFESHNLLQLWERPKWRTVKGGSRKYISSLMAQFAGTVRLSTPVATIKRDAGGVTVLDAKGNPDRFDQVLVASHADQALRMLEQPSSDERDLLGAFASTNNTAVLHTDARYMPRRRRAWSSWNYMALDQAGPRHPLCVSYWMNQLHGLEGRDLFVTLNPPQAPQLEIARFQYAHPVFDAKAIAAQQNLWRIQGQNRTWFAGAYFGRGFHEDGLQAGLAAAEAMGSLPRPWSVRDPSGRITLAPPAALAA
ncbi:NAD(P)/FAD-dependent oxidoreductase [Devosia aurantiaca]|uniref:NAD(P)/FAD-dependent oxidoreductase n=1 Tax=Devosia aurantiaca TaxID=2714858 RepID=UPI002E2A507D|nr:FAD-dependent oxidoreductase [Devosia aurantiaca]